MEITIQLPQDTVLTKDNLDRLEECLGEMGLMPTNLTVQKTSLPVDDDAAPHCYFSRHYGEKESQEVTMALQDKFGPDLLQDSTFSMIWKEIVIYGERCLFPRVPFITDIGWDDLFMSGLLNSVFYVMGEYWSISMLSEDEWKALIKSYQLTHNVTALQAGSMLGISSNGEWTYNVPETEGVIATPKCISMSTGTLRSPNPDFAGYRPDLLRGVSWRPLLVKPKSHTPFKNTYTDHQE